ncbi:rhomboid family intramembrane serine protease [Clostridium chauvoei]|uniref:rhomboid family intramembrane serine protease n=1 Tax=Clostridium chauvoei TaxID=46867 RepID=UPI002079B4D2|nr:rhomboid family intramembrane serine protease [Clostridium chauvoei]
MKKFEKVFYNLLTKEANFFMRDYYSNFHKENKWLGVLDLGEVILGVIVTSDSEEDINYREAKEYLAGAFDKPHILNSVVLVSGEYINNSPNKNKLIFSLKDRKILYCSETSKILIPIIEYMVKIDTSSKQNLIKYKLTYSLILINILIYIISAIKSKNFIDIDIITLIELGAKVNLLINEGQIFRFITSAFLHGGIIHIIFNMMALKIIGVQVEQVYGRKKYAVIYFASAIGSSALSYILSPQSISVGASGAVFGLLGAMFMFGYKNRKNIGKEYMINIIQVIILNIAIGLTVPNIDNFGHIGGLIVGSLIAAVLFKRI